MQYTSNMKVHAPVEVQLVMKGELILYEKVERLCGCTFLIFIAENYFEKMFWRNAKVHLWWFDVNVTSEILVLTRRKLWRLTFYEEWVEDITS